MKPTMKRNMSAATLLILSTLLTAPAKAAPDPTEATLTVEFSGIETLSGHIMIGLYDEAAWVGGKSLRNARLAVTGPNATIRFPGVAPGRYGLKSFHDLNDNGTLDTNASGIPTEPYSFSNNASATMGPPSWEEAAFALPSTGTTLQLNIR